MGRLTASLLALALGAAATLCLLACGGGGGADLLPGATASEINSNLDQVERLAGEGDCVGAQDAAAAVSGQIEALGGVDKRLKQALREGATRLNEVVAGCEETAEETTPAVAEAEEPAAPKKEKPAKSKPQKEAEEPAEETTPAPPSQAEEEAPPAETGAGGTPSGGVAPGAPVGGE